uniref:MARVEL domain-containing protein n=1 Tax=Xiphophorus couchianus TaxID=32473 RepID=A0A3B5M7V2_9TELE
KEEEKMFLQLFPISLFDLVASIKQQELTETLKFCGQLGAVRLIWVTERETAAHRASMIKSVHFTSDALFLGNNISLFCWFPVGCWTFLYFVSFCFLANQWSRTKIDELPLNQGADAARAAIAFSFFSIITWAGLTVRAVQKYLLGTDMTLFTTEHMDGAAPTQPYPSSSPGGVPAETTEAYQSPPFTENNTAPTYQVPIY